MNLPEGVVICLKICTFVVSKTTEIYYGMSGAML